MVDISAFLLKIIKLHKNYTKQVVEFNMLWHSKCFSLKTEVSKHATAQFPKLSQT